MMTIALIVISAVFGIAAWRSPEPLFVALAMGAVGVAFFGSVVLVIKLLGPLALMDSTQITAAYKMASKSSGEMDIPGKPVLDSGHFQKGVEGQAGTTGVERQPPC